MYSSKKKEDIKPIKCVANGYNTSSFFLVESNGRDKRFVVSVTDKQLLLEILTDFLQQIEDTVQVKIIDFTDREDVATYYGEVRVELMTYMLEKFENVIFHHGFHDLMLRNPITKEYIVFDEHGLIYVYPDTNYGDKLEKWGVNHSMNEVLKEEMDHFHYVINEADLYLKSLINYLALNES